MTLTCIWLYRKRSNLWLFDPHTFDTEPHDLLEQLPHGRHDLGGTTLTSHFEVTRPSRSNSSSCGMPSEASTPTFRIVARLMTGMILRGCRCLYL